MGLERKTNFPHGLVDEADRDRADNTPSALEGEADGTTESVRYASHCSQRALPNWTAGDQNAALTLISI